MLIERLAAVAFIVAGQIIIPAGWSGTPDVPGAKRAAPAGAILSPSSSSIVATWNTLGESIASFSCGTKAGSYEKQAVDNGRTAATLTRQSIVAGLQPSTKYYCQIISSDGFGSTTSILSSTTAAPEPSTPIKGISLGTINTYNGLNPNNHMNGDTFYNCKSNDGITYLTTDDTQGWQENGYPAKHGSPLSLVKLTSESPLAGVTVNPFGAYGRDSIGTGDDLRTQKNSGLFCMAANIYMSVGRQLNKSTGRMGNRTAYSQVSGQIILSRDKGRSWNNFQAPEIFNPPGSPTTPPSASMFGTTPTNMASATFVMYCSDDGTLGYLTPCNRHDNADAYVYLMANDGYWDSGNALYLARVPRSRIAALRASDYEYYSGGNGSFDENWTTTQTHASAVISNPGKLGEPNVQFVPALNRYLLLTFCYPQGLSLADPHAEHSLWLAYEAPHPWGPWTLVQSIDWPTEGYYNPVILNDTVYTGMTPLIMFTGNFWTSGTYQMYLTSMSILH